MKIEPHPGFFFFGGGGVMHPKFVYMHFCTFLRVGKMFQGGGIQILQSQTPLDTVFNENLGNFWR